MTRVSLAVPAAAVLAFLALPFVGLALGTDWPSLKLATGDVAAISVSLTYTAVSLAIIVALGTPLAYWLAHSSFRGKAIVEMLVLLPLLTPPLAMGILLATVYGPYSYFGRALETLGIVFTNSAAAFVLAQVYGASPYYIVTARVAFEAVNPELEQIARTLGKSRAATFRLVTLPLAALGLAAGIGVAWVRALGEFGIVLVVAYFPQGIPVKLWVNLQDIGIEAVYPLLWLFFLFAMPLPLVLGTLSRRRVRVT